MNIYRRLFVWFFAANLVTLAISIAIAHAIFERGAGRPPDISELASKVQASLDSGTIPDLSRLHTQRRGAILVRNGERIDGSGRIPSRLRTHLEDLLDAPSEIRLPRGNWLVSQALSSHQGGLILIVRQWPPKRAPWHRWMAPVLQVLVSILGIGIIGWIVSRHLTRPLSQLQVAVRSLAAGNLDSRVDPDLANRSDEYGRLAQDFDRMASRIKLLVSSRDQLLHDVSHELRAPLARLRFSLELARDSKADNADEMLQRSDREIGRIDHLVADLLELARLERPRKLAELPRVELRQLVAELVDAERPLAKQSGVEISLASGPPLNARMEAEAISRAIENVIRNAVRFSPKNSTVRVSVDLIVSRSEKSILQITVQDAGPGVEPELLPRLFEPFYRAPASGTEQQAGDAQNYGLGLAIVDRIMRAHGGQAVAVNGASDRGTSGGLIVQLSFPQES